MPAHHHDRSHLERKVSGGLVIVLILTFDGTVYPQTVAYQISNLHIQSRVSKKQPSVDTNLFGGGLTHLPNSLIHIPYPQESKKVWLLMSTYCC